MVHSFNKIPQGGESEELQCIVCSDEPPSVRFEPCGHTIACKGMDSYLYKPLFASGVGYSLKSFVGAYLPILQMLILFETMYIIFRTLFQTVW